MLCDVATAWWRKLTPDFLLVGGVSLQGGIAEHHAGVHTTTTEAARMFLGRGARAASGGSV